MWPDALVYPWCLYDMNSSIKVIPWRGRERGIFNLSRERSEILSKSCSSKNVKLENLDLDRMRPEITFFYRPWISDWTKSSKSFNTTSFRMYQKLYFKKTGSECSYLPVTFSLIVERFPRFARFYFEKLEVGTTKHVIQQSPVKSLESLFLLLSLKEVF